MNKCQLALAAMLAILPGISAAADGAAPANRWYVAPMLSDMDADVDRMTNKIDGLALAVGREVGGHGAVELGLASHRLNYAGNAKSTLKAVTVNGLWIFSRGNGFAPYALLGVGAQRNQASTGKTNGGMAQAGLGLMVDAADNVSLRAEVLRRHQTSTPKFDDNVFNLGVQFAFGGDAPPPAKRDSDGDGVSDPMDECPRTPKGHRVDARGCTVVEPQRKSDHDGDGVADAADACPNTVANARVDARGCELDDDGDGVVNSADACPGTPPGTRVDYQGCKLKQTITLEGVQFETNSSQLRSSSKQVLADTASTLKQNPDVEVEIAGYTDDRGDAKYNQWLSQRRAEAVRKYLVAEGVNGTRLTAKGYGEADPVANNDTAAGRASNRRVELHIEQR